MTFDDIKSLMLEQGEMILVDRLMFYSLVGGEIYGNCRDGCCRCEYSIEEFFGEDGIIGSEDLEDIEIV
jgi:hypothetical protein